MTSAEITAKAKRMLGGRGARRIGIAAVVLALLWSAAWFYVPAILRSQAERIAGEQLGRRVSLGAVRFNPWTLDLTIDDLAIAGASATAPPQLEVKRIHADAAVTSLFRLAPVIDALEIESPTVRLTRLVDGGYDIDDILARIDAMPASPEPARFALHNIVVSGGAIDVADLPMQATHQVRGIALGVPFLSTLPSQRKITVEPHLAFVLDGSRFDSSAAATPWAERGNGEATIRFERFDIARWLGYLPKGLPVRPQSALVSADLRVAFEQRPALALKLSGTIEAADIALVDAASQRLVDVGNVKVRIDELRPLQRIVRLARVEVDAPHVRALRDASGRINLLLAAPNGAAPPTPVARVPLPTSAASAASRLGAASAPSTRGATASTPWTLTLSALSVRAGQLDWRDATTTPAAALALSGFTLDAQAIAWPLDAPVVFKGGGVVGSTEEHGRLDFSGQGNASGADVKIVLDALPLGAARPYVHGLLEPALGGALSADLAVAWRPSPAGAALRIDATRIALASLSLGNAKTPEIGAEQIELLDGHVDTLARTASIGKLALRSPRGRIERDAAGQWSFQRWQHGPAPAAAAASSASRPAVPVATTNGAWKLTLGELAIEKGRFGFADLAVATPVHLDVTDLALQLHGWALDGAMSRAPFHVAARVSAPAGPTGKAVSSGVVGSVDVRGELGGFVGGAPTQANAALLLKDLPMHLADPYFDGVLDIDVQKAQTGFKGDVAWDSSPAGTVLHVHGDASVDDFRASNAETDAAAPQRALAMLRDPSSTRQLLAWKSLSVRGIDVRMAPGAPLRIAVAETALSDFFARVVLDEKGRLNLQDVARPTPGASAPTAGASATAAGSSGPPPPPPSAAAASGPGIAAPPAVIVTSGPIALVNGRVAYNDRFVRPNYSANLSELTGRLAAFSSQPPSPGEAPALADLSLTGRVEGTASLEITGKVNPLAKPLALDLQATVRDLELPPLSPYAIKYSGYGIERGKMSVDLAYVVQPDGRLTASNKIVLHQLAFGDKVPGATASLPVKLAVALLSDRHGVIDLDLPVSGSINDPQFSLGGLIWKVVVNLVVKAVTSPFSLLSSAIGSGGGDAFSTVEFAPGTATLAAAAKANLDKVAQALVERPALTLTVSGESRLATERDAWKRDRLRLLVRAEKRRQSIAGGADPTADVVVADAEYPALLKEVYKRADIVKPKNIVGFAKDLPTGEMEALLIASVVVGDDAMQQLATRRAVAVRDYLATRELPTSRLFLGAPKTMPEGDAWTPRAELKLTME